MGALSRSHRFPNKVRKIHSNTGSIESIKYFTKQRIKLHKFPNYANRRCFGCCIRKCKGKTRRLIELGRGTLQQCFPLKFSVSTYMMKILTDALGRKIMLQVGSVRPPRPESILTSLFRVRVWGLELDEG